LATVQTLLSQQNAHNLATVQTLLSQQIVFCSTNQVCHRCVRY
jgi:hypothetical protein